MRLFAKGWSDRKDGPGHRRIYYLKGCNLCCRWCASPESISPQPQLMFYEDRAYEPIDWLCPRGALRGKRLDRAKCTGCSDAPCRSCRHPALEWAGTDIDANDLYDEILRLRSWGNFGGVTFGGGEPTLQAGELIPLLRRLREGGIHTVVESNAATDSFPDIVPEAGMIIADLKSGSAETFQAWTGGDLNLVLANLDIASRKAQELLIRIPFIPDCNGSKEEIHQIIGHLRKLRGRFRCEVIALHHYGQSKYAALGIPYPASGVSLPTDGEVSHFENELRKNRFTVERN